MARLRNEPANAMKVTAQARHVEEEMELDLVEQVPTILIEMVRGKKILSHIIEAKVEESKKWIKLLLWPG